jgi:hypothetical protein
LYTTIDGEKLSEKRIVLILKMLKKIEANYLKSKQETENEIIAEINEI